MKQEGGYPIDEWRKSWHWGREYFRHVRPAVIGGLEPLYTRAQAIPNPRLREQALSSLQTKQFHCEGGGVFGGPSRDQRGLLFNFLLPYQTLCDYLDTVTDRGPSQDPVNLRALHQSLLDAVNPNLPTHAYYRYHPDQDDGEYAQSLVQDARAALLRFPGYTAVQKPLTQLVELYVDLQVFKHGPTDERTRSLTEWFNAHYTTGLTSELSWWEFSAAAGSTLGLFALLNLALDPHPGPDMVNQVMSLYFPWLGALHILLDYYVDQEEDRLGGDLNFVTYYASRRQAVDAIRRIYHRILREAQHLPDAAFHRYVAKGLLGFYLSDQKVRWRPSPLTCQLLASGGTVSVGIYLAALVGRSR